MESDRDSQMVRRSSRRKIPTKSLGDNSTPGSSIKRAAEDSQMLRGDSQENSNSLKSKDSDDRPFKRPKRSLGKTPAKIRGQPNLPPGQTPLDFALQQVTPEELRGWKGWCEIESDPVSRL
jgi:hypothetical protein